MISFRKAQSIALWLHIPMWALVAVVVVIIGAYHAGIRNAEARQAAFNVQSVVYPMMTLEQLQKIPVSSL